MLIVVRAHGHELTVRVGVVRLRRVNAGVRAGVTVRVADRTDTDRHTVIEDNVLLVERCVSRGRWAWTSPMIVHKALVGVVEVASHTTVVVHADLRLGLQPFGLLREPRVRRVQRRRVERIERLDRRSGARP